MLKVKKILTIAIIATLWSATFIGLLKAEPGNGPADAVYITSGTYSETLNETDTIDFYNFTAYVNHRIHAIMIPPTNADFQLELHNPFGDIKNSSYNGVNETEEVEYYANVGGNWSLRVSRHIGEGNYTLILDPVNYPPEIPNAPSGVGSGYVYTSYLYHTSTNDTENDTLYYEFNWGDDTLTTSVGPYNSGVDASASHQWKYPVSHQVKVRAKDDHGNWSDWSSTTVVTLSQNDANSGQDAANTTATAFNISLGSYKGTIYYSDKINDTVDFYNFTVSYGKWIHVTMTPPSDANFQLELHAPDGNVYGSYNPGNQTESIDHQAEIGGNWSIRVNRASGEGQYSFSLQITQWWLTVKTYKTTGSEITNVDVWIDSVNYHTSVTLQVDNGTHTVIAIDYFARYPYEYTFDHWEDGPTSNSRAVDVQSNVTLKAYYYPEYIGGGGGCPTLFVWNGAEYVYEELLNIHAESDITLQHQIQQTLVREGFFYKLQLQELDEFTSHIDQVKLYAVDREGKWHLCLLTYAYHSELGKATWKLMFDDQIRVDLAPTQVIDLRFISVLSQEDTVCFIFEINGYNQKTP